MSWSRQDTCLGRVRVAVHSEHRHWLRPVRAAGLQQTAAVPLSQIEHARICGQGLVYSVLAALPGLRCALALEAALRF